MKTSMLRGLCIAGALTALGLLTGHAQTIEFRATINAAQETTGSTSTGVGMAVLLYDVGTNTFDLAVTINSFTNIITASHIHEGAPGVAGPVVTNLGTEAAYRRNGAFVTQTFTNIQHNGTPLTLLRNGAYVNFHTSAYPGGELRGQLIAQPKRLVAVMDGLHEVPVNTSKAYGAAYISYDPGTNKITTRLNIYNYTNTLSASHYHEAPVGVSGPVVHNLGGAAVYTKTGTSAYGAVFVNQTYLGDTMRLLTGGAYLNAHSNIAPGGEIRGQVRPTDELDVGRLANMSARGFVGAGDQALISGFVISGTEPVRVLITAKGPSLAAFGVTGALANPMLSLHDASGTEILTNDDFGTAFGAADMASTGFSIGNASEAGLLIVLPPGAYSTVITGSGGGTGIALTEVYEVRPGPAATVLAQMTPMRGRLRLQPEIPVQPSIRRSGAPLEFCIATPLALVGKR